MTPEYTNDEIELLAGPEREFEPLINLMSEEQQDKYLKYLGFNEVARYVLELRRRWVERDLPLPCIAYLPSEYYNILINSSQYALANIDNKSEHTFFGCIVKESV